MPPPDTGDHGQQGRKRQRSPHANDQGDGRKDRRKDTWARDRYSRDGQDDDSQQNSRGRQQNGTNRAPPSGPRNKGMSIDPRNGGAQAGGGGKDGRRDRGENGRGGHGRGGGHDRRQDYYGEEEKVDPETARQRAFEASEAAAPPDEDVMAKMKRQMGFNAFSSTQNKKVPGNEWNWGIARVKKAEYRQYMNRKGGFNRPLSPSRNNKK